MNSENKAIRRLINDSSKVSCHYFIKRNGQIILMVPDLYIAWHAGQSNWNKENSLNKFLKKSSQKHYPATGEATLCGSIIECDIETGLAKSIKQFIHGGVLQNLN